MYYLDWVRAIAIELVVFVHCTQMVYFEQGIDWHDQPFENERKFGMQRSLL